MALVRAAAIVALRIAVHRRGRLRHASSLVMAFAVCGTHYTNAHLMERFPVPAETAGEGIPKRLMDALRGACRC